MTTQRLLPFVKVGERMRPMLGGYGTALSTRYDGFTGRRGLYDRHGQHVHILVEL